MPPVAWLGVAFYAISPRGNAGHRIIERNRHCGSVIIGINPARLQASHARNKDRSAVRSLKAVRV
jgi:hypothetical protein